MVSTSTAWSVHCATSDPGDFIGLTACQRVNRADLFPDGMRQLIRPRRDVLFLAETPDRGAAGAQ